jgi:hypothetical protein
MPSSGMLRRVAIVRTNVSEEHIASVIRLTRIDELGTTLAATSNANVFPNSQILVTLMMAKICSCETSVHTRATRRNIPEDGILRLEVLSGPRFTPTATQKNWHRRESNTEPVGLQPGSLTTRPQRRSLLSLPIHILIISSL